MPTLRHFVADVVADSARALKFYYSDTNGFVAIISTSDMCVCDFHFCVVET